MGGELRLGHAGVEKGHAGGVDLRPLGRREGGGDEAQAAGVGLRHGEAFEDLFRKPIPMAEIFENLLRGDRLEGRWRRRRLIALGGELFEDGDEKPTGVVLVGPGPQAAFELRQIGAPFPGRNAREEAKPWMRAGRSLSTSGPAARRISSTTPSFSSGAKVQVE